MRTRVSASTPNFRLTRFKAIPGGKHAHKLKWMGFHPQSVSGGICWAASGPGYHVYATYKIGGEGGLGLPHRRCQRPPPHTFLAERTLSSSTSIPARPSAISPTRLEFMASHSLPNSGRDLPAMDAKARSRFSTSRHSLRSATRLKLATIPMLFCSTQPPTDSSPLTGAVRTPPPLTPQQHVLGTIKLDGKPEFAASGNNGEIWVNIEDKSELSRSTPISCK